MRMRGKSCIGSANLGGLTSVQCGNWCWRAPEKMT